MNTTYEELVARFATDLLQTLPKSQSFQIPRIGIGITTAIRSGGLAVFKRTLEEIVKYRPSNSRIVVVDDATDYGLKEHVESRDGLYYRFNKNVGIARAKNKCFELLQDCEHIFLFDDDTFPLVKDWYLPYLESRENHLMYIFEQFKNTVPCGDIAKIYQDDKIAAYTHVRGCMLYYKQICLKTVGGMDVAFGKWGNEHGDLSNRIYAAGLNTFRYMDVANSQGLFYSGDEHQNVTSTFAGTRRIDALDSTTHIFERQRNSPLYREYREKRPAVVSTYYTDVIDPQRGHKWSFDKSNITGLVDSTVNKGVQLYLLTDVIDKPIGDGLTGIFVKSPWNPYLTRWVHYYQFLYDYKDSISWAFLVDATDVEMINTPNPVQGKIYIGSENTIVDNLWLRENHSDMVFKRFYQDYGKRQLLNAGVVGGHVEDLIPFCKSMIDCICDLLTGQKIRKQPGPGLTDMAVLNLVAYTQYADKIVTGTQVTTEFKANARNDFSWFKHK